MSHSHFRRELAIRFDEEELKDLCRDLNIDYENLKGETLKGKIGELTSYLERRSELHSLVELCVKERPKIEWRVLVDQPQEKDQEQFPDIDAILEYAKETAIEAGIIVKTHYRRRAGMEIVSDEEVKNLTTEADHKANNKIIANIESVYKNHQIITEETHKGTDSEIHLNDSGYTWVIDAIDGTVNFFLGIPIFCTAIGILYKGNVCAGVIYDPMREELYYAQKGGGAWKQKSAHWGENEQPRKLKTNSEEVLSHAVIMTHLSSRRYARERFTRSGLLDALANAVRTIRAYGSGQLSLAFVAQGILHGFVNNSTYSWDQTAGLIIVEEAGGIVSNFQGQPWKIDSESIIASANRSIHNQMVAIISAIYPFEGPLYRLRDLLQADKKLEKDFIKFVKTLSSE